MGIFNRRNFCYYNNFNTSISITFARVVLLRKVNLRAEIMCSDSFCI